MIFLIISNQDFFELLEGFLLWRNVFFHWFFFLRGAIFHIWLVFLYLGYHLHFFWTRMIGYKKASNSLWTKNAHVIFVLCLALCLNNRLNFISTFPGMSFSDWYTRWWNFLDLNSAWNFFLICIFVKICSKFHYVQASSWIFCLMSEIKFVQKVFYTYQDFIFSHWESL